MTFPSDETAVTPEKVRTLLAKIEETKKLTYERLRLLDELAHTVVARVVEPKSIYTSRFDLVRCARCGGRLAAEINERVLEFDGRFWHAGKCE